MGCEVLAIFFASLAYLPHAKKNHSTFDSTYLYKNYLRKLVKVNYLNYFSISCQDIGKKTRYLGKNLEELIGLVFNLITNQGLYIYSKFQFINITVLIWEIFYER